MRLVLTTVVGAALSGAAAVLDPHQITLAASPPSPDAGRAADDGPWPGSLPSSVASLLGHAVDRLAGTAEAAQELATALAGGRSSDDDERPRGTIYELIRGCGHTSRFAKLVDHHPDLVELLNSSRAEYTLFVPTNEAFRHIPDHHDGHNDKPSKELVENFLRYHVGLGQYPAGRILHTHTLPTALHERFLGGEPQRLRTSIGFHGVEVNFYSTVVAADIKASNGIIHAVDHILVPPFMAGQILTLFPGHFSTLLLAYEKTDFIKYIHGVKMVGSTVLAPSNYAFKRLGVRANAFLFNTETGRKYLRALLKYHITPNATFYTDSYYDKTDSGRQQPGAEGLERRHYELPTLLGDARVAVDVVSLGGLSAIRINGFAHISIRDGVAKNGVIQVLDQVLIPPCSKGGSEHAGDIDVEDLKTRLEPYL
ncbi:fasciclin domain-containing protein [Hirsutella rhossiliensis]|uniref:Fasciclin domain-containing protein n=1 Tax=Hirsutella rhossiliensis TaxID=111463 RepID=A0A9P8N2J3_9HYPO|nr:fasciclin domain-containing protein [Hirsutella rhossiliensis]KAH0964766.1 fasciclin domain-containing protein [Hirsutella rhossiliensis]